MPGEDDLRDAYSKAAETTLNLEQSADARVERLEKNGVTKQAAIDQLYTGLKKKEKEIVLLKTQYSGFVNALEMVLKATGRPFHLDREDLSKTRFLTEDEVRGLDKKVEPFEDALREARKKRKAA